MTAEQRAKWERFRVRGRADFALRIALPWATGMCLVRFVFGRWSDWREMIIGFLFFLTFFLAACWYIFWPMLERRYHRSLPTDKINE